MWQRLNDNDDSDTKFKSPIDGCFEKFGMERPVWSLREGMREVEEKCERGEDNFDIDLRELRMQMGICNDVGVDKVSQGEAMGMDVALVAILTLYSCQFTTPNKRSFFEDLNFHLRAEVRKQMFPYIMPLYSLMWALSYCPVFEGTVYRGVKDKNLARFYSKNRIVIWYAFTSCTTDPSVLEGIFLGKEGLRMMFIIKLRCLRARIISSFSMFEGEKEVILPPNTRFLVEDVQDTGHGLTLVFLEELPSKDPIVPYGIVHEDYCLPSSASSSSFPFSSAVTVSVM